MKLTHKIYLSYLLIGLITIVISWLSYSVFKNLSENFTHFIHFSDSARIDLELARDVSEIQRQALIYTDEGHPSAVQRVNELYEHMAQLIRQKKSSSTYANNIGQHLEAYIAAFRQLQQQRDLQYNLVHYDIRIRASQAEQHLREYIRFATTQQDKTVQVENERALNTLLLIEKNAMRYFDSLNPQYVAEAKQNLDDVRLRLQQLLQQGGSDGMTQHLTVDAYQRVILEAVQRTRAYLFLVNVVMSAEAAEIVYHASQMSEQIRLNMDDVEKQTFSTLQHASSAMMFGIFFSLVLMLVLALLIGQSITRPILRLATAFKALAQGSARSEIPAYRIDDELGQLTHAANVFREKNKQTERLLDDLADKKRELERSNDEMEQFVYTVSHDLKSPLVTSMGFISIIQKLAAQGRTDEAISKLDRVIASNERMGQLINDLLELSRVGRTDMDKKWVDLNRLLANFHQTHAYRLQEKGITLDIADRLPAIYANESRILQLFENLLSNALKYGQRADGNSHISIDGSREAGVTLLRFSDNGPGIDSNYHEKIFNLFYRLSNDSEGTGIGLAVAAKVMKFHHGRIWVESTPGEGATFWLRFDKIAEGEESSDEL